MPAPDSRSLVQLPIATELGEFIASYSERGLAELHFPSDKRTTTVPPTTVPRRVQQWHRLTSAAVNKILAGHAPTELPPLDQSGGTAFQQSVWRATLKIPRGQTLSYGEIASAIGKPKALRAVGGACGANPIPVIVPCHRVLAANQKIGGFSSGLDWKRTLLAREGVRLS